MQFGGCVTTEMDAVVVLGPSLYFESEDKREPRQSFWGVLRSY